jgi:flavin reductase (DIM6/NTAB) family NADH-FMN oxidoreductase RutF/DNA-binding IclR family transcriptional regulator
VNAQMSSPLPSDDLPSIDAARYRQVLGQYPTGVCVITARSPAGEAVAMVVGSFSSVSLDPPLVAFFPDRKSSSWAKLRACERFCVNILNSEQEDVCRKLASKDPDKFAGVAHRLSEGGNPVLDGAVGWIDCRRHAITDAGDHEMVTGRVLDLDVASGALPLLFFRGGYGRFAPASLAADERGGIGLAQLRVVDRARPAMERLAEQVGGVCLATVRVADGLVIAASAGQPRPGGAVTLVGQHLPFAPPTGSVFAAWLPDRERSDWAAKQSGVEQALHSVRDRGYSVGLRTDAQRTLSERLATAAEDHSRHADVEDLMAELAFDPPDLTPDLCRDIRLISAPVFDRAGNVAFALTIHDFGNPAASGGIDRHIAAVVAAATSLSTNTQVN